MKKLFGLIVTVCLILSATTPAFATPLNDPLMLYTFDAASGADTGSAGNDATAVGTPMYSNKAQYDVGPSGKYVSVSQSNYLKASGGAFQFGTDAFSLSFWINIPDNTPSDTTIRLFQTGLWGNNTPGFAIAFSKNQSGTVNIATGIGSTGSDNSWDWSGGVTDFFDSQWHHLVFVFDQPNDTYNIYLDGSLAATRTTDKENLSASTTQSTVGLGVFLWYDSVAVTAYPLSLDELTIYERALSKHEIETYYYSYFTTFNDPLMLYTYNTSTGEDTGPAGNDATAVGTPTYSDKSKYDVGPSGKFISIDSNNYLKASGSSFQFGTNAFSLAFWVNIPKTTPSDTTLRMFQTGLYGANTPGFAIAVSKNEFDTVNIATGVGSTGSDNSWEWSEGVTDFFDSQWHHLAFVFDQPNDTYSIYLDGSLVARRTTDKENLSASTTQSTVGLGVFLWYDSLATTVYPMSMDELTICDRALSPAEIATYYNSFFTTIVNDPVMLYTFEDGSGTDSGSAGNGATTVGSPSYVLKSTGDDGPSGKYITITPSDYLKVSGSDFQFGTGAFSLSFWIKISSNTPSGTTIRLFQTGVWGDYTPGFATALTKNGQGTINIATGVGSNSTEHSWSWSDPVADFFDSEWHHMAFIFDQPNNIYYVYLDSDLVVSKQVAASGLSASTLQNTVGLGVFLWNDTVTDTSCSLSLDDIAIYDRALTEDEISVNYDEITSASDIYYIDSEYGCDNNSGKSTLRPWKSLAKINTTYFRPGSRINIKSGTSYNGQIKPITSGESGRPITLTNYGGEEKPTINGNGVQPATIHLFNLEYWEISDLKVTNYHSSVYERSGILVENQYAGTLNHIYIINNEIYNCNGDVAGNWGNQRTNGGIIFNITAPNPVGTPVPSKMNDVLIENNYIHQTGRSGIFLYSVFCQRYTVAEGVGDWYASTNVVVRNNILYDIGGDGIVLAVVDGALIEHNTATLCNNVNGDYNIAIWCGNCDDTIIQYNEASYTQLENGDAEGFDLDFASEGCILQYNYSHNNEGGSVLVCSHHETVNIDPIVRYNIFQNDLHYVFRLVGPYTTGAQIYNNTAYIDSDLSTIPICTMGGEGGAGEALIANNIFYNEGSGYNVLHLTDAIGEMIYDFDQSSGEDTGFAGNDATTVGSPTYTDKDDEDAGPAGKYISVTPNDYLKVSGSDFQFGTGTFSISCWVNIPSSTPYNTTIRLFQTGVWGNNTPGFVAALTRTTDDGIYVGTGVGSTGSANSWSWEGGDIPDFFDSHWHHLAFIFDQEAEYPRYMMFLDGYLAMYKSVSITGLSASTTQNTVGLGVFLWNDMVTDTTCPFAIDDIRFYKCSIEMSVYDYAVNNGVSNVTYSHNCFYSTQNRLNEPFDDYKIITDPRLHNPGAGTFGFASLDGYQLDLGSPCIDAGMVISGDGDKDFWGNTVPYNGVTDIGAHEYQ